MCLSQVAKLMDVRSFHQQYTEQLQLVNEFNNAVEVVENNILKGAKKFIQVRVCVHVYRWFSPCVLSHYSKLVV